MTRQITNLIELVYIAQHDSQDNLHSLLLTNNIKENRKMKLKRVSVSCFENQNTLTL